MHRTEKETVVADLAEQLRSTESLIVADYRGLTNADLVELRAKVRSNGGRFQVVKNTLTRRAAEEAGTESLLALLEGPTAIAFIETEGDPVAVAKALADTAKDTKVLTLRGGILSGREITGADVEELAKLPALDVVKSQLVGVVVAPLTQLAALLAAPLRDLVGVLDARIEQLGSGTSADAEVPLEGAEVLESAEAPLEGAEAPLESDVEAPDASTEEPAAAADEGETLAAASDGDTQPGEEPTDQPASEDETTE